MNDSAANGRSASTKVAMIGLVQALIWPAIAIFAMVTFAGPIARAIDAAANGGGATVEIAGLKITLPRSNLPPPPSRIRNILPSLNAAMIQNIIANYGGNNRVDTCYPDSNDAEFLENSARVQLKNLGLIRFEKTDFVKDGAKCPAASMTTYTPEYDLTRDYLIEVLKNVHFQT